MGSLVFVAEKDARYGSDIQERAFEFAVRCVRTAQYYAKRDSLLRPLVNQFLRSATSVGANLEEAIAAESKPDFLHKMRLAQKEARETKYWIRLLQSTDKASSTKLNNLLNESDQILRVVSKIIVNTKNP